MLPKRKFVSFSQNGEDVVLHRALGKVTSGFYIDVGAGDPEIDSVTLSFYTRGWNGINIEPNRDYFKRLEHFRSRDFNIKCAAGASVRDMNLEVFAGTGLSTFVESYAAQHKNSGFSSRQEKVRIRTLNSILSDYPGVIDSIQFLKVDVEGFESEVFSGLNLSRYRPWVIVYEATKPNSNFIADADIPELLTNAGYTFVFFDGLNKFFVSQEHIELAELLYPTNCLDNYIRADCRELLEERDRQIASLSETLAMNEESEKNSSQAYQELQNSLTLKDENLKNAENSLRHLNYALKQKDQNLIEAEHALSEVVKALQEKESSLESAQISYDLLKRGMSEMRSELISHSKQYEESLREGQKAYIALNELYDKKEKELVKATEAYEDIVRVLFMKDKALLEASLAYSSLEEALQLKHNELQRIINRSEKI